MRSVLCLRPLFACKRGLSSITPDQKWQSLLHKSSNFAVPGRIPLTKIVATIGPSSEAYPQLDQIVNAGMRVLQKFLLNNLFLKSNYCKIMRINFSHATYEEADLRVRNLKLCKGLSSLDSKVDNLEIII
jgi:hypothetical protein